MNQSKKIYSPAEILSRYQFLLSDSEITPQSRGYEFERLIESLLYHEQLEPRASYQPEGEQIDGSFFWEGQTFLLEAKWVKEPIAASSIYAFKGKLDGKFHTCSGVFLSVNGYGNSVEDALKFGKSLNILLFDKTDIPLLFEGKVSFLDMLKFKLRQAGDTGTLRAPYILKEQAKEMSDNVPVYDNLDDYIRKTGLEEKLKRKPYIDDLLVFVEGLEDSMITRKIFELIKDKYFLSYKVITLRGENNFREIPSLVNLYGDYKKNKAVIIIADDDNEGNQLMNSGKFITEQLSKSSVPIRSTILLIPTELKDQILRTDFNLQGFKSEPVFQKLDSFIEEIAADYYNPMEITPKETLKYRAEQLQWDLEGQVIYVENTYEGYPYTIDSLEKLINYLNEEIIQAMYGEMPGEWLKEQDELDYEVEVREFLLSKYSDKIEKIGWNPDDL